METQATTSVNPTTSDLTPFERAQSIHITELLELLTHLLSDRANQLAAQAEAQELEERRPWTKIGGYVFKHPFSHEKEQKKHKLEQARLAGRAPHEISPFEKALSENLHLMVISVTIYIVRSRELAAEAEAKEVAKKQGWTKIGFFRPQQAM
jgi:hypothetical protein